MIHAQYPGFGLGFLLIGFFFFLGYIIFSSLS